MKDEIQKIIADNVYAMDEFDNVHTSLGGHGLAADELQRLMCYREVRAFCFGYKGNINHISDSIISTFEKDYSASTILEAIEKVKNEQE